ncbi:MAG: hypothetical protein ABI591_15710 [Kofleriaceae bacterium]
MTRILLLSVVLLHACGDDGNKVVDASSGTLGYTGELVDWDENDATFCGVLGATLTVHGDASLTKTTPPNGRLDMMVPDAASVQIDVTPPTAASECALGIGLYQLPGLIVTGSAVINSGTSVSYRMIGMDRVQPFFSGLGVTFDAAKAIVFVHVEGNQAATVTSSAAHDTALAWNGTAWAAGTTGVDIVFPNTAVGTTMVDAGSGALGAGSIPAVAGTFTYVTLVAN